jgi:ribosomal protein S12 methylthiotransferase accessory factor YcaO
MYQLRFTAANIDATCLTAVFSDSIRNTDHRRTEMYSNIQEYYSSINHVLTGERMKVKCVRLVVYGLEEPLRSQERFELR